VVNTSLTHFWRSQRLLASREGILLATGLSRIVSQNELIGLWVKESLLCSLNLDFLPLSGENAYLLWSMSGISCLQLRSLALHPSRLSISENLTFPTSEYGGALPMCMLTRVLHVPDLRSNLLSCLYLARHKGFNITISAHAITFKQGGTTLFTATIHSNNSAELDGSTAMSETAYSVSTLPLDLNLWHRRFIHHNYADVRAILSRLLITGLKLDSNASPDPICEPCLAGKMHALPFRSSSSHNRSPLELVHSDLHGPLPVTTHSGNKYWITFIDDATRFRAVYLLKAKSEAFEAFKVYKSWAENQLGVKLRALQDDKGSEYMSKAFLAFTEAAGIERRHSTRNRPQQNSLAE
jgi:hypothetical protein